MGFVITHYKGAIGYKGQNKTMWEIANATKNKNILLSTNISYRKFPCDRYITKASFKGQNLLKDSWHSSTEHYVPNGKYG